MRRARRAGRNQSKGPSPFVEGVEHVGLAEIDLDRAAARSLSIIALEVAVDAGERHLQRDALCGPSRDDLERGPNHSDQVAIVFPAEERLDLAAVVYGFHSVISFPDHAEPVQREIRFDVVNERGFRRDDVGQAAGRDADRVVRRAPRPSAGSVLRPCRRSPRTSRIPSRRSYCGRRRSPASARRFAAIGRRAETARRRKSARPDRSPRPGIRPSRSRHRSVVAVPKSSDDEGAVPVAAVSLVRGNGVDDPVGADLRRAVVKNRHARVRCRAR